MCVICFLRAKRASSEPYAGAEILVFLNLENISKSFAISNNIKRSFCAKNVKKRNHMYQKLKLLLINSLSRQPLLFSASYSDLKYLKGLQILRGYWHWKGRPVLLTEIFGLFYLFFTWVSSRGAFAPITVMQRQLDLTDMSTNYWR